jgi:galactose mutarotase-like enzyme
MITLENDLLRVTIRPQGAELTSLFNKQTQIEHLWQADPAIWGWHAPNLFPVVGGCLNNQILIDRQAYPMERHGFARRSIFELDENTDTSARFSLSDSDETRDVYPYRFKFGVEYTLNGPALTVTYRVENTDDKDVFFSVGGHPAFNVPMHDGENYNSYFLEFDEDLDGLETHRISPTGFFTGETAPLEMEESRLWLGEYLFNEDALVIKNLDTKKVVLRCKSHNQSITVDFADFDYLGIWSKPGAPFVCIEPWLGCADSEGRPVAFSRKEGIQEVAEEESFTASFVITVA